MNTHLLIKLAIIKGFYVMTLEEHLNYCFIPRKKLYVVELSTGTIKFGNNIGNFFCYSFQSNESLVDVRNILNMIIDAKF